MIAHKHGPSAHVLYVGGEGSELLFVPGEKNAAASRSIRRRSFGRS
jgi:hypothetical protein